MNRKGMSKRGSLLVFTLWVLALLIIFVIYLGAIVRQKIILAKNIEESSHLRVLEEAGIHKAIAILNTDLKAHDFLYTTAGKQWRHNNPFQFKDISFPNGKVDVDYIDANRSGPKVEKNFGFEDEESKININKTKLYYLENLLAIILDDNIKDVQALARAIIDWREELGTELKGFYDEQYSPKHGQYELFDEMLLVEGMTPKRYEKILPFVTIYGDGAVNINTASPPVLFALGLSHGLLNKIITVRRGPDGKDATADDVVFPEVDKILPILKKLTKISEKEEKQLKRLIGRAMIKTNSRYFRIHSEAFLPQSKKSGEAICVFDAASSKIVYWKESRPKKIEDMNQE